MIGENRTATAKARFPSPYGEEVLKVKKGDRVRVVKNRVAFPYPYGEEVLKVEIADRLGISVGKMFPSPYGEEVLKVAPRTSSTPNTDASFRPLTGKRF